MSRPPQSLDGYTLIRELGRGGMGIVYEAHDPRLDRRLALKLVLDREADAEALLRFQRESELLARINHPNVLRIHQVGTSQAGPYFVSELVEGEPLDQLLRRSGALAPQQVARLVRDLASGTAALHEAGVIHRDLKPGNVVLRADGSPVLIDFGLARDPQAQRLTMTGALLGTPHYMSPEQALGGRAVGPPSDVYALGSILFALLTGGPPHAGLSTLLVLDAIAKGDSVWSPSLRDTAPPPLVELCQQAHAKDPDARPSAAELARQLEAYLVDPEGVSRSGRGGILVALLAGLALLGLGLGWGASTGVSPEGPSATLTSAPTPSATVVRLPDVNEVIAALKRPSPEIFADAQALLERGRGERLATLRNRYVGARLLAPPTRTFRGDELPAHGRAAWFDQRRLVVTSETRTGLWWWADWSQSERDYTGSPGDAKMIRRGPLVFEGRIYQGGFTAGAAQVDVFGWGEAPPRRSIPAEAAVRSLAAARIPTGEALLAVGLLSNLGEREGKILIFDLESGRVRATLSGHRPGIAVISAQDTRGGSPGVAALAFTPDGTSLVSGGLAGAVIVWDVATWEKKTSRILNAGDVRGLACHPSRPLLAVASSLGQRLRILNLSDLATTSHEVRVTTGDPGEVAWSRDGRFLFGTSNGTSDALRASHLRSGEFLVYDLESSSIVRARRFSRQAPRSLQLSPDGRRLALYSRGPGWEGILEVWEIDVPPQ
jgi:protein kinase-like protein/WD40 domain-containing protein